MGLSRPRNGLAVPSVGSVVVLGARSNRGRKDRLDETGLGTAASPQWILLDSAFRPALHLVRLDRALPQILSGKCLLFSPRKTLSRYSSCEFGYTFLRHWCIPAIVATDEDFGSIAPYDNLRARVADTFLPFSREKITISDYNLLSIESNTILANIF